ncbi:unnamed protein product [Caenorhabditis brenneri]
MKYFPLIVFYSLCNIVWSYYVNDSYYVPEWNDFLNHQQKLLADLFQGYDSTVAPVYTKIDVTKPIGYNPAAPKRYNYTVYLYYLKLVEVIEPEEKVSVVLEMAEYWYDPRLAWDTSKYGDIQMLHMRQDRGNAEWDLVNLTHRVELLSYDDGTGDMQLATFEIKIRRNPMYYIYMIVFPSFIINALSIIGVFMRDSDKMPKLNVGLTNIMTMTFILGVMADKIPKTGSIPMLGIYIIMPIVDVTKPIGYDPVAPKRFNYTVSLYYLKLVEVIEPEEKVSVVLEIAEYWYDPRLAWDSTKYDDIKMLHMRQDRVWSPTINSFRINDIADFRDQDFRMVCVENTGQLFSSLSSKISVNCPMKVDKFPFDSQTCVVQFCLPLFYMKHVEIFSVIYEGILNKTIWEKMVKNGIISLSNPLVLQGNSEWDLVNLTNRVELLTYKDGLGDLELATFEIKIRRNPMYYIYMIVFPSFVINALSIIGVFMKKTDKMSKLNVGLTNIMTMTFILGVMADKIPKTGSIPLLGIYIIINLFIMIFAVGLTIVLNELRRCTIPRLRSKKNRMNQKLEYILGDPLETICMTILELLNAANFSVMIGFWISDS